MKKVLSVLTGTVFALAIQSTQAIAGVTGVLANLSGMMMQIMLHESGHAAVAAYHGWHIMDFRPYPNICGGKLVGGCVISNTDLPQYEEDGTMNRRWLGQSRTIAAAGSMTSNLSVILFAPLVAKIRPTSFFGEALNSMLFYQNVDWLFYTVTDSFSNFQGDWHSVASSVGVPTYYFIAPAALNYWLLSRYRDWFKKKPGVEPTTLLPEITVDKSRNIALGLRLKASF